MSNTTFDYSESDDWVWGYGATTKNNEYVINISGGGDGVSPNGFEDWVIKKVGGSLKYYIRHGGSIPDNEQKGKKIVSCPEGNYVSFQDIDYGLPPCDEGAEMDFEWLEEELGETDERMITMIDNLTRANEFLQKITEEQTQKIKELVDELECRKSYTDTRIKELEAENEELEEKYIEVVQKYSPPISQKETIDRLCKEHNITKEEFAKCVEESSDYDIKDFEKYLLILELEKQQGSTKE